MRHYVDLIQLRIDSTKMIRKTLQLTILILISAICSAQNIDFTKKSTTGNLFIRMYGEVHYYQPIGGDTYNQGQFDAKRIVALFGYQFDRKTQFVTEWELEHADEIFLEQAFIKHRVAGNMSIKAGMILIPMGIINENHEPNNYYSVDRPVIDRLLVPTTWRDIGIGITGLIPDSDIKYQAYLVNGLLGYADGSPRFKSSNNFRSGRQKGSKTIFSGLPALSTQIEYFGFENGKIGLSWYAGKSNTDAYSGIEKTNEFLTDQADSTTVFTNMLGLHSSFQMGKLNLKSQLIYSHNSGVEEYNAKGNTDLGKSSLGLYVEAGIPITKNEKWIPFLRYSYIDSNLDIGEVNGVNKGLNHYITTGINYMAAQGAVFKIDGQWSNIHLDSQFQLNAGIGVWF